MNLKNITITPIRVLLAFAYILLVCFVILFALFALGKFVSFIQGDIGGGESVKTQADIISAGT